MVAYNTYHSALDRWTSLQQPGVKDRTIVDGISESPIDLDDQTLEVFCIINGIKR